MTLTFLVQKAMYVRNKQKKNSVVKKTIPGKYIPDDLIAKGMFRTMFKDNASRIHRYLSLGEYTSYSLSKHCILC